MSLLTLTDLTRRFSGFTALDAVTLQLRPGEVLAIVGENGAGKSTLVKILSGVLEPDDGRILLDNQEVRLANPVAARRLGVYPVHQEVEVFPTLSLAENLALALGLPRTRAGLVDWRKIDADAALAARALHKPVDVRQPAGQLKLADRQMARIAAALAHQARILLLDEPTSSLSESETRWLFQHVKRMRAAGVGVIYISHRQSEIYELADRIAVLRDGRLVWCGPKEAIAPHELVEATIGRQYTQPSPRSAATDDNQAVRLRVTQLCDAAGGFERISLDVCAGEVVGVYGLVGAGRSEFAQGLFGLRRIGSGRIEMDGAPLTVGEPAHAIAAGIAYLPEDRLTEALLPDLTVRENVSISSLNRLSWGAMLLPAREKAAVKAQTEALAVRCRSVEQPARQLSGGNQQKSILARWFATEPRLLILDEPTRGVDVGAKAEIHRLLRRRVESGLAVLMISSDLSELIEHADRILVFREGKLAAEFSPSASPSQIAQAALPLEQAESTEQQIGVADGKRLSIRALGELGVLGGAVGVAAILAATHEHFLSAANLLALFTGASVWAILALAASVVIIAGGIDISIGAILALAAAVCALVLGAPLPVGLSLPLSLLSALAVGTAAGGLNAAIALSGRVHPIVVTLATMTAYRGLLIMLTGGEALTDLPPALGRAANARFLGVNGSIVLMIVTAISVSLWQRSSVGGRHAYALGSNPVAAHTVGVSRARVWLVTFGLGGLLSAIAGVLELAQTGSMQSSLGAGYELRAIAAAVIGGTAITGGRGTAFGVLSGALLISLVHNALVLWQVSRYHTDLVIGVLILGAVLWDLAWRRLERRHTSRAGR